MTQRIFLRYVTIVLLIGSWAFKAAEVAAYQLVHSRITFYDYADDRSAYNRLYFGINDEEGNFIPNGDVVTDVKLYDPSNNPVSISDYDIANDYEILQGSYDGYYGKWSYNDAYLINGYSAHILDALVQGTYRLVVTTDDSQTHETTLTFNETVSLPYILSSSFEIYPDTTGNLFFSWDIPDELCRKSEQYSVYSRAYIGAYSNQELVELLWTDQPAHLNRLYIPATVVEEIRSMGDEFWFAVALETRDGNNRFWSEKVILTDLSTFYPSNVKAFVTRFYQQCLARDPDQSGLDYWVDSLEDGSRAGADVANGFVLSQEFIQRETSNQEFLGILYRAFFDRDPDDGGLAYWLGQLANNASRQDVLNGFIYAQEFYNLCDEYGITSN